MSDHCWPQQASQVEPVKPLSLKKSLHLKQEALEGAHIAVYATEGLASSPGVCPHRPESESTHGGTLNSNRHNWYAGLILKTAISDSHD